MARLTGGVGAFVVVVMVVVLVFLGTTLVTLFRAQAIGDAAEEITANAVPSLRALLLSRSDAALLRIRLEAYVARGEGPYRHTSRERVVQSREQLEQEIAAYVSLPSYALERQLWESLLSSVSDLRTCVRDVLALRDAGDAAGAARLLETRFLPALERFEHVVMLNEEVSLEQVRSFTAHMESVRTQLNRDVLVLNGLSVVLAVLLVSWALRRARLQRELEARYTQALRERADEMEIFAGRVAHDILSPLASASLALEMLTASPDDETRDVATRGTRGVARIRATVDGLLEFARAGARPNDEVATDVVEVANDVVEGLRESATAAGVSIELDGGVRRQQVAASRGVVISILTNLVQNAIKCLREMPDRRIWVELHDDHDRVRVEVCDTGPGVPPDLERRIFEPYFRVRHDMTGLGLGLATVKRLVEAHSGHVGVRSRREGGAVFWFELPRRAPANHA